MANNCMTKVSVFSGKKEFDGTTSEKIAKFIEENIEYTGGEVVYEDENLIEWSGDTRWSIPQDQIAALAKTFGVSVRAVGDEPGIGFVQVVCANEKGKIVQDAEIGFAL